MARENYSQAWQGQSPKIPSSSAPFIKEILELSSELRGEIIVIKLTARIMEDETLLQSAIKNIATLKETGAHIIIVHDHANILDETLKLFGIDKKLASGAAITNQKTAQIIEMALSGYINKKIVSALCSAGASAIGISCKDGQLIEAKKQVSKMKAPSSILEFGFVGEPSMVNPEILITLSESELVIVISPVAFGPDGSTYLLDVDLTAAIIASMTTARNLVLPVNMSEVNLVGECSLTYFKTIFNQQTITDSTRRHAEATISALENYVEYVHLVDEQEEDTILLSILTKDCGAKISL
ncbi:MAG: acetylglutamate kinase [Pseudomonadota bacterium]